MTLLPFTGEGGPKGQMRAGTAAVEIVDAGSMTVSGALSERAYNCRQRPMFNFRLRRNSGFVALKREAQMSNASSSGGGGERRGGGDSSVNISGVIGTVEGDIVGGDKIVQTYSPIALEMAFRPLDDALKGAPSDAAAKLAALKTEAAKGTNANDGVVATLVNGLVGLVPAAASAVVSAFGTPILAGIAGPVTKIVLDKLQGK